MANQTKIKPTKKYKGSGKPHTITTKGEKTTVSVDVHLTYNRPEWAESKQNSRIMKCDDENGNRCTRSCRECDAERAAQGLNPKEKISCTESLEVNMANGIDYKDSINVEAEAASAFFINAVNEALSALPPDQRVVAALHLQGYTEREIGEMLSRKRSQTWVRARKAKALAFLQQTLAEWK